MTNFSWFRLNRSLHRDIGYFCVGMTLIFAISGIALNHIHEWNSNYQVTQQSFEIVISESDIEKDDFEVWLLQKLAIEGQQINARFWQSPSQYKLFLTQKTIYVNLSDNQVVLEEVKPRFLLRSLNFLHLNEAKKAWTLFSDFYAGLLIFLAISALFMVKGKRGVLGIRGGLVISRFALPAFFVVYYAS